jgi:hypothetical protein
VFGYGGFGGGSGGNGGSAAGGGGAGMGGGIFVQRGGTLTLGSGGISGNIRTGQQGHDTRALQAYLGHRNIQHTVRYTGLSPTRFKDFWRR